MLVEIDTSDSTYVNVTVRLAKSLLDGIAQNRGDPLQVYGVSVFGRLGTSSCYWDFWYANGKKKCECIQI